MRKIAWLFALLIPAASAREISWKSLDVSARLDADSTLRVVEKHTMIFDGEWNGGERTFRVGEGQQLRLLDLRQIDPQSRHVQQLRLGNLAKVGDYGWSGPTLRWRTRLPSDPPYRAQTLIFEIDYALRGVVYKRGSQYLLQHDFAFPERSAPIEHFTLKFELDPVWQAEPVPPLEKENIPPGEGVVLRLPLVHGGTGEPAAINRPPAPPPAPPPPRPPLQMSPPVRIAGVAALLMVVGVLVFLFFRHEKSIGRFDAWDTLLPSDEEWLRKNVFSYPAEVIGAAWDETSGEPEVSALLARLIQEGKIKVEPNQATQKRSLMQLRLMARREELQEHELALVRALFVEGDTTTRAKIQMHYRSRGFDPAAVLRGPLMGKVEQMTARAFGGPETASRRVGGALAVTLAVLFFAGLIMWSGVVITFTLLAGGCLGLSLLRAARYRRKLLGKGGAVTIVLLPLLLAAVAARVSHPVFFAICAIETVFISWYVFRKARWHGTREFLGWRRNLIAARDWFAFELSKPNPQLKDEWTPYLIAFGLSSAMNQWSKSFAAPRPATFASDGNRDRDLASIKTPAADAHSLWTGGGGAFGGAGASGSWAMEVSKFAAAVAPPPPVSSPSSTSSWSSSSSSSSTFSSSSSSSSSGGGGGGGW